MRWKALVDRTCADCLVNPAITESETTVRWMRHVILLGIAVKNQ